MATGHIARVLLDSSLPQLDHLFDYRIPESLLETAVPGVRVKVPFRSAGRTASGYLIELSGDAEFSGELSSIEDVVSPVPVLRPEVWKLARRIADRSAGSASDIIRLAVPPRQVRVEKAWLAAQTLDGDRQDDGSAQQPAPLAGYAPGRLEAAIGNGQRLAVSAVPLLRELDTGEWVGAWAVAMAHAAAHCLSLGKTSILIVPDHRDQEQLLAALAASVPQPAIVRLDARQSNADRYRSFLTCLEDQPRIIVGNRSAVYAPAEELGLIALWDDGDRLNSEPLSPYANARDVALVRQEQASCALIVINHSRTTDIQRLVELGWLGELLPEPAYLPHIIPTAEQHTDNPAAATARIPSLAWREATRALQSGPVLIQVARPGYAPVLACRSCRTPARCNRCAGPLGLAHATATPACGWCGALATGWHCSNCEGTGIRLVTIGASRTAEELGRAFPGVRIIVSDGTRALLRVDAEPALVIATRGAEPIASGGYKAVILLDGERMLARESLRVAEDCLRSWSNAAALAAPKAPVILAGVGGALASTLSTWRQPAFASAELAERRTLRFPPAVRTASVTGTPVAVAQVVAELTEAGNADVLGPVDQPDGTVRAIVRLDYAHTPAVAATLRAAVIRNATRRKPAGKGNYRAVPTLKIRFDDPEIL